MKCLCMCACVCWFNRGKSGSPVFNRETGKCIGIHCGFFKNKTNVFLAFSKEFFKQLEDEIEDFSMKEKEELIVARDENETKKKSHKRSKTNSNNTNKDEPKKKRRKKQRKNKKSKHEVSKK
eukprot:TRINITY_DN3487_c0_g1_i2.p2 TRINITY_DN3487_c0_g1~~TRINITY_DN3487_c0_g1_i2.p2  ORF type:complete len:122 (+),score=29.00 TRINITY_DN3487_c0_g1_i2:53-418(+)